MARLFLPLGVSKAFNEARKATAQDCGAEAVRMYLTLYGGGAPTAVAATTFQDSS